MAARNFQLSRKSRGYVGKLNILKNVPVLNIFLVPEHQNFWDNEPVLISSKTNGEKQPPLGITFSSRADLKTWQTRTYLLQSNSQWLLLYKVTWFWLFPIVSIVLQRSLHCHTTGCDKISSLWKTKLLNGKNPKRLGRTKELLNRKFKSFLVGSGNSHKVNV